MYRLVVLLLLFVYTTDSYKVLICYPVPAKSVNNLGEGIVRHLLDAGHEVTFVTVYPKKGPHHPKLRIIDLSAHQNILAGDNSMNISYILENDIELSSDTEYFQDIVWKLSVSTFENANVRELTENPKETFDVVIVDLMNTEIYSGLAALYDAPMIWSYSMGVHWQVVRLVDDATNPAYATDYASLVTPPFNFKERLEELWQQLKWRYVKFFKIMPKEKNSYENIFGPLFSQRNRPLPVYDELIYNASLVLCNEHHASGTVPTTPQNLKLVGGFHIQNPPNPLPKDLQTLMDNAKHGVIYFSMGSIWKSELIPKSLTDDLLRLFGSLKETVLWKYEADLANKPPNVHTVKWAPQPSVLAHPNCKLFISHGGLLSSTEALHFGVPTIGIPVSYDQYINIDKAVSNGYALKVRLSYDLVKDLAPAIEATTNDPKFKEKAKYLSSVYHDRPLPPGKELVHWVEHVVRTRGATHLRSPAREVSFFQKAYLDIIALGCAVVAALMYLIKQIWPSKPRRKEKVN